MKVGTSINKSVWWSTCISTILYITTGLLGGMALTFGTGQDLLSALSSLPSDNQSLSVLAKVTSFLYPIITIISGIPIYSLIVRYNLIDSGLCKKSWANFWGVILPWIISLPFYSGNGLNIVINWTSLLFNGVINFVIPLVFYLRMMQLKHYGLLHKLKLPSKMVRPFKSTMMPNIEASESDSGSETLVRKPTPKRDGSLSPFPGAGGEWDESSRLLSPTGGEQARKRRLNSDSDDEEEPSRLKQFFSTPLAVLPKYFSFAPMSVQSRDDVDVEYLDEDDFIDPVESDEELVDLGYFHPFPHRFRRRLVWFKPWIFATCLLVTMCVLNLCALILAIVDAITQPSTTCC